MSDEFADASQDDALIRETDNSGDLATAEVDQSPDLILTSETDTPPEVTG